MSGPGTFLIWPDKNIFFLDYIFFDEIITVIYERTHLSTLPESDLCGESLQRAADRLPLGGQGFLGRIRYANHRIVWYFLTFLVLCGLVFLFVV